LKIVFHEKYFDVYSGDPASAEGRLDRAYKALKENFEFVQPEPAREEDLLLVHSQAHISPIEQDTHLFEVASLAVGGAIRASEMALAGEPAFGLIRPPGHHASPNSCWGFCYFNNIAIAIRRLIHARKITRALIMDFDLHFGDGTNNTFAGNPNVVYHHMGQDPKELENFLSTTGNFDMLAVSAGFDRGIADWGGTLTDEDYEQIGRLLKEFSQVNSQRRRFAVLEGGYNHTTLGRTMSSFIRTFG
jgi:acetoin utilization deacetylase AcuC-like enzyme